MYKNVVGFNYGFEQKLYLGTKVFLSPKRPFYCFKSVFKLEKRIKGPNKYNWWSYNFPRAIFFYFKNANFFQGQLFSEKICKFKALSSPKLFSHPKNPSEQVWALLDTWLSLNHENGVKICKKLGSKSIITKQLYKNKFKNAKNKKYRRADPF